mgnify:CR=1 FL=1
MTQWSYKKPIQISACILQYNMEMAFVIQLMASDITIELLIEIYHVISYEIGSFNMDLGHI